MDELIRLTTTVTITTMPPLLLLLPRITVQTARDFLVIKLIRFFFLFVCSRARARVFILGILARLHALRILILTNLRSPWLEIPVLTIARIAGM